MDHTTSLTAALTAFAIFIAVTGECPDIVTKAGWNAGPVTVRENMTVPVPYVLIHHTYIPGACNNTEDCSRSMRAMQSYHQSKGWNDIGYSFVIGGDNKVYEGRGWDIVGAHSPKYNFMSIGISFIGDYRTVLPSEEMLNLSKSLIECGIARGSIQADYKLLGHRQVRPTECPGDALYNHIQTWPHWDPMTDIVPRDPNETSDVGVLINIINANTPENAVFREAGCPDIVTKAGWNAGPVTVRENMTVPVPYVVIHHTYIPGACHDTENCSRSMRAMQNYHQGKGWNDIGYSFCIGGDNKVYEGRGWDTVGAHSPKYNFMSIGICFIGDYRTELPSEEMLNLAKSLIECGIARGSIQSDYKLLGHRQVRSTECPGEALFNHIKTWSHWDPMIDIVPREPDNSSSTIQTDSSTPLNIVNANITASSTHTNIISTDSNAEKVTSEQVACPQIVTREDWNAAPVTGRQNLTVPVPYIVIHHTVIPGACNNTADCSTSMRSMQRYHQQKGWGDIGYNFVVGGDNKVYEGRGWDVLGTHSSKYNSRSIGIAFIGDYRNELPSEEMLNAVKSLIGCGVARGFVKSDYKLIGHGDVEALHKHLQTWPHWETTHNIAARSLEDSMSSSSAQTSPQYDTVTAYTTETVPSEEEGVCPDIVTKEGWNAAPVTSKQNMTVPVPYVVIHHTYHPGACNTTEGCSKGMKSMQRSHQAKGWNDIGYNFVIGGDNKVYEGRGWDIVGAHSPKYNFMSIGISFIGDYRTELPSEAMLNLAKSLIACGIARGSIKSDYKLVGHKQVRSTECPGEALYSQIKTWPHWDPLIDIVPRVPSSSTSTPPQSTSEISNQVNVTDVANSLENNVNTGNAVAAK